MACIAWHILAWLGASTRSIGSFRDRLWFSGLGTKAARPPRPPRPQTRQIQIQQIQQIQLSSRDSRGSLADLKSTFVRKLVRLVDLTCGTLEPWYLTILITSLSIHIHHLKEFFHVFPWNPEASLLLGLRRAWARPKWLKWRGICCVHAGPGAGFPEFSSGG